MSWFLMRRGRLFFYSFWVVFRFWDISFFGKMGNLGFCYKWRGGEYIGFKKLRVFLEIVL